MTLRPILIFSEDDVTVPSYLTRLTTPKESDLTTKTFPAIHIKNYKSYSKQLESYIKSNNKYYIDAYTSKIKQIESAYPGIGEYVANEANGKKALGDNYIEIKKGGISIRLDAAELSVTVSEKMKFTPENMTRLKDDLANALEVVAQAAKLDDKLRPQTAVEI